MSAINEIVVTDKNRQYTTLTYKLRVRGKHEINRRVDEFTNSGGIICISCSIWNRLKHEITGFDVPLLSSPDTS